MESFFSTLKIERVHRHRYTSRGEVRNKRRIMRLPVPPIGARRQADALLRPLLQRLHLAA